MPVVKTAHLLGPALDWAVGFARTLEAVEGRVILARDLMDKAIKNGLASPSTDWAEGGPIIEGQGIYLRPGCGTLASICEWDARIDDPEQEPWLAQGETVLIAAMRCYVASKLGDEVEIPPELEGL